MKPFECSRCGECCGPVPVNELELKRIKIYLRKLPKVKLDRLKNQKRSPTKCIFYDVENKSCGVYNMRPEICKMFGFYEDLVCPRNPEHATLSKAEGIQRITKHKHAGILTLQITWDNIFAK